MKKQIWKYLGQKGEHKALKKSGEKNKINLVSKEVLKNRLELLKSRLVGPEKIFF